MEILKVDRTPSSLPFVGWIGLLPSLGYLLIHMKLEGHLIMVGLVLLSQVVTKVLKVQLQASLGKVLLHAIVHLGILAFIVYRSGLTDTLSLSMAVLYYISSIILAASSRRPEQQPQPAQN